MRRATAAAKAAKRRNMLPNPFHMHAKEKMGEDVWRRLAPEPLDDAKQNEQDEIVCEILELFKSYAARRCYPLKTDDNLGKRAVGYRSVPRAAPAVQTALRGSRDKKWAQQDSQAMNGGNL